MWSAVVFTCRFGQNYISLQKEVKLLQKKGLFPAEIPILVVDDAAPDLGSGGSTLNALLVITEHLCAYRGYTVLNSDILSDVNVLIVHLGRQFSFDPCGFGFLSLSSDFITPTGCSITVTPLVHLYLAITQKLLPKFHSGLWVCGCDALVSLNPSFELNLDGHDADLTVFTTPVTVQRAVGHGVYKLDKENIVQDIVYNGSEDQISTCQDEDGSVSLVMALMHMSIPVAQSLLGLHSIHPLMASTYLGIDSGAFGLKLSLFFDFLLATCSDVKQEDFVNGRRAGVKGQGSWPDVKSHCEHRTDRLGLMPQARTAIWNLLRGFKTKAVKLDCDFNYYFSSDLSLEEYTAFLHSASDVLTNHCQYIDRVYEIVHSENSNLTHCDDMQLGFEYRKNYRFEVYSKMVSEVLMRDSHDCVLPLLRSLVLDGLDNEILYTLDNVAITCDSTRIVGRTLSTIADVLGILADGQGGLRSGPASHPDWLKAFELLDKCDNADVEKGVRELSQIRKNWMNSPNRLIRAARHYEAAAQIFIRKTYISLKPKTDERKSDIWCCAEAAARIDVAGGWSDTPPITYEYGGAVLNIAIKIDTKKPVGARCRKTKDPEIRVKLSADSQDLVFVTLDQIKCYNNPSAPGALICASLICCGLIDPDSQVQLSVQIEEHLSSGYCGLIIETWSHLPHGSGLGTSSVLAGCILAVLWSVMGQTPDVKSLLHAVLYVEQLLTTGGGWQDQVGGLVPAIKIGRFGTRPENTNITVQQLSMPQDKLLHLQNRLLLVYTGRTRLAKNLLQEAIRNWYSRKRDIVQTVTALVRNAENCAQAVINGDIETFAQCAKLYWEHKKRMAPGCEPAEVKRLVDLLYAHNVIDAGWLAGAGGGGFLYLLLSATGTREMVDNLLAKTPACTSMTVHSVEIDSKPLNIYFEN